MFGYQNQSSTVLLCQTINDSIKFKFNSPWNWYYSPPFSDSIIFQTCSYHDTIDTLTNNDYLNIESPVISLYPNPLITKSIMSLPEVYKAKETIIDIYDIQGIKCKSINEFLSQNITLNRTDFKKPGLYIIQVRCNYYVGTYKLLVQ